MAPSAYSNCPIGKPGDIPSYYRNQHIEELSGDGVDELSSNIEASLHATVPVIYSSLSPIHSLEVQSDSYFISSTKFETDMIMSPTLAIFSSIDYSIENSSDINLNGWQVTQFSLPYPGPSSLVNTLIFQPSIVQPTPTVEESSTNLLESSKLREKSWWEIVDEVPITSQESQFSSPLPSIDESSFKSLHYTSVPFQSKLLSSDIQSSTMIPDFSTLILSTPSYSVTKQSENTEDGATSLYVPTEQFLSSDDIYSGQESTYRRHLSVPDSSSDDLSDRFIKDSSGLIQSFDRGLSSLYTLTSTSPIFDIDQSSSDLTVTTKETDSDRFLVSKITDYTSVLHTEVVLISSEIPEIMSSTEKSTLVTDEVPYFDSIENYTLADMRYWLRTVIRAEPKNLPSNFLNLTKKRLERIYDLAFKRSRRMSRNKREESVTDNIKIQFIRYIADWKNQRVELVYTVDYLGEPILAEVAISVMDTINNEEFSRIISYDVITKVEAYLQEEEEVKKMKPWVIYAVIGAAGCFLFFLICVIFLYCRYCHVHAKKLDVETDRKKSFGEQNRQQVFEEDTDRMKIVSKDDKATEWERPLPALPKTSKQKRDEIMKPRMKKTSSEKILLITVETQTEGYYNPAYESDITDSSLSSVTSNKSSPDKSSKEFKIYHPPAENVKSSDEEAEYKSALKDHMDSSKTDANKLKNILDSSVADDAPPFENDTLFNKKLSHAFSDTDADRVEAEMHLGKVRQKIGDLLDDAFAFTGPKRIYSSFRNKQVLPESNNFQRWTSLRSPNRHQYLTTHPNAKSLESLPDDKHAEISYQPLFTDMPPHKQPPTKPRVVWSIYKVGEEISEPAKELQEQELEHSPHPVIPEKLFEHRTYPTISVSQAQPLSPSSLVHPSFRPFSAPIIATSAVNLPYATQTRFKSQPSKSIIPMVDVHPYRAPYKTERLGNKRDEIDTATVLKFRQPAQSVIQAIRDELKKFNTSFPNDDTESFA
ncbi:uncharacterized protein LOC111642219 [Centruroides sculpturatus]|uniref:uncharacterized protein LOC111642219 n=1 Tax=Centruroides sculpturatus TaxID=218467 RepID=UPI000C6CD40C|nr:uncharacterized protein LOC111642219 [Centruroides sculpturatus]